MFNLQCENCGHFNPVNSEYIVFCEQCNKKIANNFKDWQKRNPDKNIDDFTNIFCISDEALENLKKVEKKQKRRITKGQLVGIIIGTVLASVGSFFGKTFVNDYMDQRQINKINNTEFVSSDTTKWIDFKCNEASFTMKFPEQPIENVQTVESEIGNLIIKLYLYEPELGKDDNILYGAGFTQYPNNIINSSTASESELEEYFTSSINGSFTNVDGKLLSSSRIFYKGYEGREIIIDFQNGLGVMKSRFYLIEDKMYTFQVITATQNQQNRTTDSFLNSFELNI